MNKGLSLLLVHKVGAGHVDFLSKPEVYSKVTAPIPMKRLGVPEEVVGPTVLLASDESSFMTGQIISCPSISAVPAELDVAILLTPPESVLGLAKECVENKVKGAFVFPSGFDELGAAGKELEGGARYKS
jgi:hypothetical protein